MVEDEIPEPWSVLPVPWTKMTVGDRLRALGYEVEETEWIEGEEDEDR